MALFSVKSFALFNGVRTMLTFVLTQELCSQWVCVDNSQISIDVLNDH